jgi:hypothetical protein
MRRIEMRLQNAALMLPLVAARGRLHDHGNRAWLQAFRCEFNDIWLESSEGGRNACLI